MLKKYEIIKQDLCEQIISGKYPINGKIPTETILMEIYKVSRFTVRHAIGELEKENYIYRIQGRGMFVNNWKSKPKLPIKNKTIGLITTHIADYIFPNIIAGIDNYVSNLGYSILIANTQNNLEKERRSLINLLSNDLCGLIIEPTQSALSNTNENIYDNFKALGIPMLFINSTYKNLNFPYLIMDDEKIGKNITNYLIEHGHKRIVGIFKVDDAQGVHRMNGYINAYQEHPEIINSSDIMMYQTEENKVNVFKKLHSILKQTRYMPTAIVCYNDQLAIQVINFIHGIGLKVPDNISVIGVDDYQFSAFNNPSITTIRHPQEKMGYDAGKMMIDLIAKRPVTPKIYEPEIIVRKSVKMIK